MKGCVSNLMVCNLLEELKKSILADKFLATRPDQDRTALHWACSARHAEIVEFLLQLGVPVNDKDDAGWSPLHTAASAEQDEIVKVCLGPVNTVSQNGRTPLHYTASENRHEIAVMLLEGGADPDAKDHCEATAMHRAAMIPILLYPRTSTNIQDMETCAEERVEAAKPLVSQGAVTKGGLGFMLKRMVEG
uniref:Uncharacterized protein n=1 Tax=Aotus nancymaae TaxID=37293 RepID=A0A2K5CFM2_AOTNA